MTHRPILAGLTAAAVTLAAGGGGEASAPAKTERTMTAHGTFDVKVTPQPQDDSAGGPFGRLFLDKRFHGDLEGTSKGQMLGAGTPIQGSAGYVALELVSATLNGKRGTFVLQHNGSMRKGVPTMRVTVVPDSGTDELKGISGAMTIVIEGSTHSYTFEYALEER